MPNELSKVDIIRERLLNQWMVVADLVKKLKNGLEKDSP